MKQTIVLIALLFCWVGAKADDKIIHTFYDYPRTMKEDVVIYYDKEGDTFTTILYKDHSYNFYYAINTEVTISMQIDAKELQDPPSWFIAFCRSEPTKR